MGFRLVQNSMTLSDLERLISNSPRGATVGSCQLHWLCCLAILIALWWSHKVDFPTCLCWLLTKASNDWSIDLFIDRFIVLGMLLSIACNHPAELYTMSATKGLFTVCMTHDVLFSFSSESVLLQCFLSVFRLVTLLARNLISKRLHHRKHLNIG